MPIRRTDEIVDHIRSVTDNESPTSTAGISTNEIVRYLNEAQDRAQSLVSRYNPGKYLTQTTSALVASQRTYALPADTYLGNKVFSVEYSRDSTVDDYYPIDRVNYRELCTTEAVPPDSYTVINGNIYLSPVPSTATGSIRITYARRLDNLDIRRGTVASTTDDSTDYLTIVLSDDSVLGDTEGLNVTAVTNATYVCVNSPLGVVDYYNAQVSSYTAGTRTINLATGAALTTGTISTGDFVTVGQYTTTHSDEDDIIERYLSAYATWKVFRKESSTDAAGALQELQAIEGEIVDTYKSVQDDIQELPMVEMFM